MYVLIDVTQCSFKASRKPEKVFSDLYCCRVTRCRLCGLSIHRWIGRIFLSGKFVLFNFFTLTSILIEIGLLIYIFTTFGLFHPPLCSTTASGYSISAVFTVLYDDFREKKFWKQSDHRLRPKHQALPSGLQRSSVSETSKNPSTLY